MKPITWCIASPAEMRRSLQEETLLATMVFDAKHEHPMEFNSE
jgi:hypothetical protein